MDIRAWFARHPHWRGKALDALVFLAGYFAAEPLTRLLERLGKGFSANDNYAAQQLSWLMIAGFASYLLGAWLKRAPLQERIGYRTHQDYAGCLFVAWLALHLSLSILGFTFILAGFSSSNSDPKTWQVIGLLLLSLLPTIVVAVSALKRPAQKPAAWRKHWLMELVADLFLSFTIVMASIMWSIWIAGIFTAHSAKLNVGTKIFGVALLTVAFAIFYLTPRFIYLVEDYHSRLTWLFILLAISPSVLRLFFGQLPLANWLDWFV